MCATSAISDYYMRQWPNTFPTQPNVFTGMDQETKDLLRKAVEMLEKIDKKLGDVDCMDAEKAAFMAQLKKPARATGRTRAKR